MVVVVELGADRLRDLGKECLVVWLVAPRLPNWRNVLAVENKMASAAGPMPGDFSECRLAGDELVNALPLVRLAVEVAGEMAFMLELARAGKIVQGRFVARKA